MKQLNRARDRSIEAQAAELGGDQHMALVLILEAVTASRDPAERQALLAGLPGSLSRLP